MSIIEDYLKDVPEPQQTELRRVVRIVKETIPDAGEKVSYGLPTFTYKTKILLSFAAFKDHLSIFPHGHAALDAVADELKGFDRNKGTLRFTPEQPIPESTLRKIVDYRRKSIDSK